MSGTRDGVAGTAARRLAVAMVVASASVVGLGSAGRAVAGESGDLVVALSTLQPTTASVITVVADRGSAA